MSYAQVQRTLVKSPPELWAELSDPATLARHLGELGEIRITRIEPEHKVEWTADGTSGSVLIKPSAWGTRVTLTASRAGGAAPADSEPITSDASSPPAEDTSPLQATSAAAPAPSPPLAPAPGAPKAEAAPQTAPASDGSPAPNAAPDSADADTSKAAGASDGPAVSNAPAPEPPTTPAAKPAVEVLAASDAPRRRRLLSRIVRRLRGPEPEALSQAGSATPGAAPAPSFARSSSEPPPESSPPAPSAPPPAPASPEVAAPSPAAQPLQTPRPVAAEADQQMPAGSEDSSQAPLEGAFTAVVETPANDASATSAENGATDNVESVLTSVLDSLGSAHHRPFSRA